MLFWFLIHEVVLILKIVWLFLIHDVVSLNWTSPLELSHIAVDSDCSHLDTHRPFCTPDIGGCLFWYWWCVCFDIGGVFVLILVVSLFWYCRCVSLFWYSVADLLVMVYSYSLCFQLPCPPNQGCRQDRDSDWLEFHVWQLLLKGDPKVP